MIKENREKVLFRGVFRWGEGKKKRRKNSKNGIKRDKISKTAV